MANNIQEYVAEKALQYAYAREEEINTLKRKLETLQENQLECVHCHRTYHKDNFEYDVNLLPVGECSFCSLYLSCQSCKPRDHCETCNVVACGNCMHRCAECDETVCIRCCDGKVCIGCYMIRVDVIYSGCPKHPLREIILPSGYTVPVCEDHMTLSEDDDLFFEFHGQPDILTFYGLIHRAQKKASIL